MQDCIEQDSLAAEGFPDLFILGLLALGPKPGSKGLQPRPPWFARVVVGSSSHANYRSASPPLATAEADSSVDATAWLRPDERAWQCPWQGSDRVVTHDRLQGWKFGILSDRASVNTDRRPLFKVSPLLFNRMQACFKVLEAAHAA